MGVWSVFSWSGVGKVGPNQAGQDRCNEGGKVLFLEVSGPCEYEVLDSHGYAFRVPRMGFSFHPGYGFHGREVCSSFWVVLWFQDYVLELPWRKPVMWGELGLGLCQNIWPRRSLWDVFGSALVLKWREEWDSNPRCGDPHDGFQDRCLNPLGHLPAVVSGVIRDSWRVR